jgi:hypothetical protein
MAEYESIHGTRVKYLTSDPTLNSSAQGQVWYNSTTGVNKSLVQFKAWGSGGTMPTATNNNGSATQGTQTASLSFGGGATTSQTIEYNGFQWTTSNNLGTPRYVLSGAGIQTAALGFGGYQHPPGVFKDSTEEYDGSSWTAGGALSTARGSMGGNGTQTAALAVTGAPLSPGTQTEEYNGSSWTAGGAYPVAQQSIAVAGPQTAALGAGGISGSPINGSTLVTNYDGSSWTVVSGTIPNGQNRAATAGGQTHAVVFGGNINTPPPAGPGTPGIVTTATNEWDGSTFTITANMATARQSYAGAGTATSAIGFGGDKNPGASDDTEEYNSGFNPGAGPAVWISIASAPSGLRQGSGMGTTEAFLGATSYTMPSNKVFEYDGTNWTNGGAMGSARYSFAGCGGTQTAAFICGGTDNNNTTNPQAVMTEEYNGSSWSPTGNLNTARLAGSASTGSQTAGLAFSGGIAGPDRTAATEEYNGSSWTSSSSLSQKRSNVGGGGIQTSAICAGGNLPPAQSITEEYNGSSWTSGGAIPVARLSYISSAISSDDAIIAGGEPPQFQTETFYYNGTAWADTGTDLVAGKGGTAAAGTASAGMMASGGGSPGGSEATSTELVTSYPGGAIAASTLTTS